LDVPILFTNNSAFTEPSKTPGFLCIPHEFKVEDLLTYVKLYLTEIRVHRRRIRNQIYTLRLNSGRLKSLLELKGVTCEASYDQSNRTLQALINESLELKKYPLESVTFHLCAKSRQISLNLDAMVLKFPPDVSVRELIKELDVQKDELQILNKSNPFSHKNTSRLQTIAFRLAQLLGARELLIGHTIASNPYLSLLSLFNIRRNSLELRTRHNFGNISLVISTDWYVDSLNGRIYFPFNFSVSQFTHYMMEARRKEFEMFDFLDYAAEEADPQKPKKKKKKNRRNVEKKLKLE